MAVITILLQFFAVGRLTKRAGVAVMIVVVPLFVVAGFLLIAASPTLMTLVGVFIARRVGQYAIVRPCREMLYTSVDRESKYKAKNVNDTLVYRNFVVAKAHDAIVATWAASLSRIALQGGSCRPGPWSPACSAARTAPRGKRDVTFKVTGSPYQGEPLDRRKRSRVSTRCSTHCRRRRAAVAPARRFERRAVEAPQARPRTRIHRRPVPSDRELRSTQPSYRAPGRGGKSAPKYVRRSLFSNDCRLRGRGRQAGARAAAIFLTGRDLAVVP
jgi:hypothetical protein